MKDLLASAMAVTVGGLVAAAWAPAQARDRLFTCESDPGRVRECAVDTRGEIRLMRQLSRSPCVEGGTWGASRGGIWVSDGCRGEFLVTDRASRARAVSESGFLRCESKDGRSNRCAANTSRGVELVRQISRSPCIRGQNWGWDASGVWVSGGCRAEFRTFARGHDMVAPPPVVQKLRCESKDGRARHCPADTRGGVRVVRQLSRTACVEGRTWGRDREGVWVEGGCRADFEIGGGYWSGR